jgi:hypothetical protein
MRNVKHDMKHLMRYEGYTSNERADDILDKISKYGISSLTPLEKEFLDSHKSGKQEELHDKLAKSETETTFEDDNGLFKFEFDSCEDYGDEVHYLGTLYVPDLELPGGRTIEGRLSGRIIVYSNGQTSPDFYSIQKDPRSGDNYDVFEFCNGLEYELDSFIDYVVSELEQKD